MPMPRPFPLAAVSVAPGRADDGRAVVHIDIAGEIAIVMPVSDAWRHIEQIRRAGLAALDLPVTGAAE